MANFKDTTRSSFEPVAAGSYDALLHGIVFLELQAQKPYKGQERPAQYQVKFIFEIPGSLRDNGESNVAAKTVNLTTSEKGKFHTVISKLLGKTMTDTQLVKILSEKEPLKNLLGSAVVLTIDHFIPEGGNNMAYISEFNTLDARIPKPEATREHIYFDPTVGDLEAFGKLTEHTRGQVMSALNSGDFPKELHAEYVRLQEDGDKKGKPPTEKVGIRDNAPNVAAIQ